MEAPDLKGRKAVMFICWDDGKPRTQVVVLSAALGVYTIDAGPLVRAGMLKPLALLWISAAYKFGFGRDFAFSIVRRCVSELGCWSPDGIHSETDRIRYQS